jgi:integrase
MPKSAQRIHELKGYWLSQRSGSAMWYRTWFDADTRQTRRVSLGTDDLESAKLALNAWISENLNPHDANPREVTLAGVFARYLRSFEPRHPGAASQLISLRMIDKVVRSELTVADFTPGVQNEVARALMKRGYAQSSIKRAFGSAKAAVNWAWKEGQIDRQIPFISLSEGQGRERILSIDELARLWDADMPNHVRVFLALAIGTASRPKAVLELRRSQCDLERRVINLNPPGRAQTKKRRPILPMADWLAPWIERSDEYVVEFRGKPVQKLAGAFQTMRDAAGFGFDVTAYTIRHTIATELAVRGVPEIEIASTLGHYMPQFRTTGRYIHYAPDYLAHARRALESVAADIGRRASKPLTPEALRASCVSPLPWDRNDNTAKSLITGAGEGIRTLDPNLGNFFKPSIRQHLFLTNGPLKPYYIKAFLAATHPVGILFLPPETRFFASPMLPRPPPRIPGKQNPEFAF